MRDRERPDKQPIEYAEELQAEAEKILCDVSNGKVPKITDSLTAEALSLMCVAASGKKGVTENATDAFIKLIAQAQVAVAAAKMVAEGKMYPVISETGELMFVRGVRWVKGDED